MHRALLLVLALTAGCAAAPERALGDGAAAAKIRAPLGRSDGAGRVQVYLICAAGDRVEQEQLLARAGAEIETVAERARDRVFQAWVAEAAVIDIARLDFVRAVTAPGYKIAQ